MPVDRRCAPGAYIQPLRSPLRSAACAGLIVLGLLAPPPAAFSETLSYEISPQTDTGRVRVELTWHTENRTASVLYMAPRWGTIDSVPGLLRNLEFGGDVSATRAKGSYWAVAHPRGGVVRCTYEVDAGRRQLDWQHAHFPVTTWSYFQAAGNAFLMTPQAGNGLPEIYDVALRWILPEGWTAVCSWGAGRSVGSPMTPDDLRHSIYLAGRVQMLTRQREGREVTVALLDRFGFAPEQFADLAARIVAEECAFMGEKSFPPFLVVAVPVGDAIRPGESRVIGMGLNQSFVLYAAPNSGLTDGFEHLFAHELFHYWNGRLLKARQPDKLVYWFTEGFTDYYALRILHKSGYWPAATYAKWINRHLREYQNNPARHATNEEIAELYWQQRDTVGEVPYQRGLLLGLRWHKLARERGVPEGLDRLFKALVERGRSEGLELTNEAIRETGVRLLGAWFGPEFDRYVIQAEPVEVPADALAPAFSSREELVYGYQLGFDPTAASDEKRIRGLVSGSEAERAGLREGDQVVAARVHADPDQEVELTVKRGGGTKAVRYYPRGKKALVLQFAPAASGGRAP